MFLVWFAALSVFAVEKVIVQDPIARESVFSPADGRLMGDSAPIADVLSSLNKINGIKFNWKSEAGEKRFGVVAQDLKEEYPSLVKEIKNPDKSSSVKTVLGVDYAHLSAVVLQGIKELEAMWQSDSTEVHNQLEILNDKMAKLEKANHDLEERLERVDKVRKPMMVKPSKANE